MRLSVIRYSALLLLALVGLASRSDAGPIIVVPPTLSPGDTYRLVFVTSTTRDATSTDIVDYNNFVSTAANSVSALAALGASWTAIGSTATMSAFDNIGGPFSEGVYRLDGGLVAPGLTFFFALPSDAHLLPIDINELGATVPDPTTVWTGTLPLGTVNPPFPLGGSVQSTWGLALPGAPVGWVFQFFSPIGTAMPLYAISSPLTVPAGGGEVPEPGTIGMTALGGALLFLARRRKQQKSQAT
jgi:hypothetical protein